MKLPLSWLYDWIDVEGSPEAIADALTTRGFYVESVEASGRKHPGVVVARVLEAAKHPNADKLKLCRVDSGAGEKRVVCGAPNVEAGMIVPLATVGTVMPGGTTIARAKIRGVESDGMLCSARELGISDDHEGIVDLERYLGTHELEIGRGLDAYLPEPDVVLEVEVPFNRPDGMGVIGLAREVKAALGGRWTSGARDRFAANPAPGPAAATFDLEIENAEDCPDYMAQIVEGVSVAPSPAWLARRLEAMGQRPISNVVDLTNLVLFEFGQPLHAFDAETLAGPAIRVRRGRVGEKLVTLDGRERALDPELLVIADRDRPVALAGVMGGQATEVTARTRTLLLECATFQSRRVRHTSRALDLATEASRRYERGVDPGLAPQAAARFISLLLKACPGSRPGRGRRRSVERRHRTLPLRPARCERLIGLPFTAARCADLLETLEFGVRRGEALVVTVPSWRPDCALEDDLVEEVARANGYDRIPEAPIGTGGVRATRSAHERLVRRAREAMLAQGLHEAWTGTLVSEAEARAGAALLGDAERLVKLANPMSREGEVLRPNVLPGLLRSVAHNLRQGATGVRLFEVGAGFRTAGAALPEETLAIAAVVTGPRWRHAHDPSPAGPQGAYDPRAGVEFFDAKGIWEAWLGEMRVDSPQWRAYAAAGWKPGASAEVASGPSRIAWAGTLGQSLLQTWGIEQPVQAFVALLDPLLDGFAATPRAVVPGRFPPVLRDLAFFVPRAVAHAAIERSLAGAAGETLHSLELFDVYEGPGTPEGMKSLAFALQFQDAARTLTEDEVSAIQVRMVAAVAKECGGRLRER